jgi:hypothetical protein
MVDGSVWAETKSKRAKLPASLYMVSPVATPVWELLAGSQYSSFSILATRSAKREYEEWLKNQEVEKSVIDAI